MVGTRLHSEILYGCVSKSGFCKFHEFPIEFAISRWWLPDLGHTLISSVKRKHGLDWFNAPLASSPEVKRLREDEVPFSWTWAVWWAAFSCIVLVPGQGDRMESTKMDSFFMLPKLKNSLETHFFRGLVLQYIDFIMNIITSVVCKEYCWTMLNPLIQHPV